MLKQAFLNESKNRTQTYEMYKRFKDGQTSTEDEQRLDDPPSQTMTNMTKKFLKSSVQIDV